MNPSNCLLNPAELSHLEEILQGKRILDLSQDQRTELEQIYEALSYKWEIVGRPKQQIPPGDWFVWLIRAGRGFGKTRAGVETIRIWKDLVPRIHLVGRTAGDMRDIMIEGESGVLEKSPPWDRPKYEPSKKRLTWGNGCVGELFSADEPDALRGPQCHKAWADELATWKNPEAWDNCILSTRLGANPQIIVTTTPRPTKLIRELIKDPDTIETVGSTYENLENLSGKFINKIKDLYEGTRKGAQELHGALLEDVEGALWKMSLIEKIRVKEAPPFIRIVVAIDPAVTSEKDSDETGIITAGLGVDGLAYVLDDLSGIHSPVEWASKSISSYRTRNADRIIGEANNGGDLIETVIRGVDPTVSYGKVWASRGKITRAEPVAALYEQGRVRHYGIFADLETEMTTWAGMAGEKSPNRVDALVWALTELLISQTNVAVA